ncbi:imidazolonepropionase [Hippea alviniae]|uniref:imidazolonepropionase n=1 Tax=Hippea alviniae TaxID=1279027 RepID=UPI0003B2EA52|nr:imidazolonepropionase [Hippea alviniae]
MIDLLIIRAEIFTSDGKLKKGEKLKEVKHLSDYGIAVKDGIITDIGKTEDMLKKYHRQAKEILDAGGKALIPGFVDPHTHAVFTGSREQEFKMRLEGKSYMEILQAGGGILNTLKKVREASLDELVIELKKRVRLFFAYGTTTFEAKSGYGLNFDDEIKMLKAIQIVNSETDAEIIPTFIGAHAIPPEYKDNKEKYIEKLINEIIPYVAENKLAEFIDVFCEKGVYTAGETLKILKAGEKYGLKPKMHADEIESIGCSELAEKLKIYSCDHLLKIKKSGIEAMKKGDTIATLLPGTAFSLKEPFANARELIDNGLAVALATDCNPGSSFSESMPQIITLAVLMMNMLPKEALNAATINAAYAIDKQNKLGSIEIGKQADFVILKEKSYLFIPYHYGVNPIWKTFKRGKCVSTADY